MKYWILDADVIIDLLSINVFDRLSKQSSVQLYAASTVIDEVRFYNNEDQKASINLRDAYVSNNFLIEQSASLKEIQDIRQSLPTLMRDSLHSGELETLAILRREENLVLCCCDAAAIRVLPFLDLTSRCISLEKLLISSGLKRSNLKPRHTDEYLQNNIRIGQKAKIYNMNF